MAAGNKAVAEQKEEEAKLIDDQLASLGALQGWAIDTPWIKPGMYHSKFPDKWKRWMIDWFRNDHLNLMLSARALAQGFDMPGADVGIIRSSTSNVRQRIQTIGRMIRNKEGKMEAQIWIVFVNDTTDERIFRKHDWEDELPRGKEVQQRWELGEYNDAKEAMPRKPLWGRMLISD